MLQAALASMAFSAGVNLLLDPTGSGMGMPPSVLRTLAHDLPFIHDFTLVAIWILVVYGAFPVILAAGLWARKSWALYGSALLGAIVVIWIGTELVMFSSVGFTWFYPLIGGIGLAILALSLLPSVRRSAVGPRRS